MSCYAMLIKCPASHSSCSLLSSYLIPPLTPQPSPHTSPSLSHLTPILTRSHLTPSLTPDSYSYTLTPHPCPSTLHLTPPLTPLHLTPTHTPSHLTPPLTPLHLTPRLTPHTSFILSSPLLFFLRLLSPQSSAVETCEGQSREV